MTDFDRATAVRQLGDGRYAADIDLGWSAPTGPNGGYLAAIVVRAVEAHAGDAGAWRLRSLTCHYLRPAAGGAFEVEVEVVRSGRRLSTVAVRASQDGKLVIAALAALAAPGLAEVAAWAPSPPAVAPAPTREAGVLPVEAYAFDDSEHWCAPRGPAEMSRRMLVAPRVGGAPFEGEPPPDGEAVEAGGWIRLPETRPIDAAWVALVADAWFPPSFGVISVPAIAPTIDLTVHIRADLPPGGLPDAPVLGWYRTTASQDGLVEEDAELFLPDGRLLAQSRQLALLAPLDGR